MTSLASVLRVVLRPSHQKFPPGTLLNLAPATGLVLVVCTRPSPAAAPRPE